MKRTITVKGVGSLSFKPDCIVLNLSVTAKDKNYEKAMEDAAKRISCLESAAAGEGFEKGDLKTSSFHVSTQYEHIRDRDDNYQKVFVGYACTYQLKLSFDFDSKRLASVLSAIADSGADPELNISFTVMDPTKIREELLANAAANAREKAKILCRASGVTLGQLINIDYNWGELNVVSSTRYDVLEDCLPPMAALKKSCAPEIEPEDISLHDTAAFVWEIQ